MKNSTAILSFLLVAGLVFSSIYFLMPTSNEDQFVPADEFSIDRAMTPLIAMTKEPHYVGSDAHLEVQKLLIAELSKLGLEPHVQEGFSFNERSKTLNKPVNIVARIKGSEENKALLLLSHYDSAPVPSFGAADAASGIVTILESVRAYLSTGAQPKNDIIILFTDAEELGLDGAKLFVQEHPWAKDVGLAINFEARGTSGPSNMILETNHGNANLIKRFKEANPKYPVATSLMYSIYKMLPNDTDSTIFRVDGDIDSFFFAFIDGHYNYHTANDTYYNLDRNSLAHQGSYLIPLLHYFADADLSDLRSETDHVYFNFPFLKMVHYPFSWIYPMLIIAFLIFLFLILYGFYKRKLDGKSIGLGFIPLLGSLIVSSIIGFLGWKLLLLIYPQYTEIQQGFPYNGHWYIAFFIALTLSITFGFYRKYSKSINKQSLYVAPLLLWIVLCLTTAIFLKGAAFFIIPLFFGLLSFFVILRQEHPNLLITTLLGIPAIFIIAPLIQFFPVGLGLKMVMVSCSFTVLLFVLLLPIFGFYRKKGTLALLCLLGSSFFFIMAHSKSDYTELRRKPNSLVYYEDADNVKAYWTTFDKKLDSWTEKYLGEHPKKASEKIVSASYNKYGMNYTFVTETESRNIQKSDITITKDSIIDDSRHINFTITPKRKVNKIELYATENATFSHLEFNGKKTDTSKENTMYRGTENLALVHYFISNQDSLEVKLISDRRLPLNFRILEYGFDLMDHPEFDISERPDNTMPKPFVLTDAIVIKHTLSIDSLKTNTSNSSRVDAKSIIHNE